MMWSKDFQETLTFICEQHASCFYAKHEIDGYSGYAKFKKNSDEKETVNFLEEYLKRRGYAKSSRNSEWVKGFVVVGFTLKGQTVSDLYVVHDIPRAKPLFIKESTFTSLPIYLDYMERNML